MTVRVFIMIFCSGWFSISFSQQYSLFTPEEVFELEYADNPEVSPDGKSVIYQRSFKDIMADANRSNLWLVDLDSKLHTPVTTGRQSDRDPSWSPDGTRIAFTSNRDGKNQIYMIWLAGRQEARLTNLTQPPSNLSWSPDGKWIAFTMPVEYAHEKGKFLPEKPEGAEWADPPVYIDRLQYRFDGRGYLKPAYNQIFLLSSDGGTPRQLTFDAFDHGGRLSWHPDGTSICFSANRHADHEYEPLNTEVYILDITTGEVNQVTDRKGPDQGPAVSPDGRYIAYTGFDDSYQGYQLRKLYLYDTKSKETKCISNSLNRSVRNVQWQPGGHHIFFQYDDEGVTKIGRAGLDGLIETVASDLGGTSLGRPYASGTFDVGKGGICAFTLCKPDRPADLAVVEKNMVVQLTELNEDLLGHKKLGKVEEIWWASSHDGRKVQGWMCTPPDFDPNKEYPLLLEIHGGPFANYGPRFAAEIQLYAAAGYVVLYTNPRGSTSYGEEFGNLIHHNYPGNDYEDLISGVDAVIDKGFIDEDQLYVTGGSGGGVLTSWIVGKTDRFRAAVVAKPVINWYSFVLQADNPAFFYKYWFPGPPWEHEAHYMKRSPISLVGNVKTPTMLLTGEEDYRTPISESEQYYTALKLNKVDAALVRIPGASHGIANKPSQLIAKVNTIISWFEKYRNTKT